MEDKIQKMLEKLIERISDMESIRSIGISGELKPFPMPGKGDFDIFIYCDEIPEKQERYNQIELLLGCLGNVQHNVFSGEKWGTGDYCTIQGIDTWMMYFTKRDVLKNTHDILEGKYLGKVDNFYYPIGRLAMFKSMTVFYDSDGFLKHLKNAIEPYPETLKKKILEYNLNNLNNSEDFERAISRKEVLFYHYAMDLAMDSFLMALFALNETYFPSRKRSLDYIEDFRCKPDKCSERLLSIIKDGGSPERIESSYEAFQMLCDDLKKLCRGL
ncbi:MAG: DUF4037 domain-containing protein [Clostridiales bacterium]|nr:DUF4037 domain-containing protein [Clostridiales bacterium]